MAKICLFSLFIAVSSYITIDSGSYLELNRTLNFDCKNNYQTTRTIAFSDTFQNIPQVFVYQYQFDITKSSTEYQFSITSITNINFSFLVKCISTLVYSMRYEWIAIDDQRVQVINQFNMNPPQDKVFTHQLLNADLAIIGITSLGYVGSIDFQLSITELTGNSVSVGITKVTDKFQNLVQIGYQILLVSSRDAINNGLITFQPNYTSPIMNLEQNKLLILPIQGINYGYTTSLTVRMSKIIDGSTIKFSFDRWTIDTCKYVAQSIWLSQLIAANQALQCKTLRISQKLDYSQCSRPLFEIQILQSNQIFNTIGQFTTKVFKPIINIDFILLVNCITRKHVVSQFNKCNACPTQKYYQFNHYCHSQINLISYFPKFTQPDSVNQEFIITITSSSCTIKQILYNYVTTEQTIINIQIQ
ncbi:unnamed protein product [Paramecium octaurelia]|uniref:H-type lectin domain-containing protein n=1 Tax=Paramecium octaurelia TaxID=43137 RepID=A0A8S1VGP4_PAROT|nr:unnamed protein product [Paramecium octaurelia]